ncbi:MAG: hypothetical protein ACRBEQ_02615 [Hyphomonas sp.]
MFRGFLIAILFHAGLLFSFVFAWSSNETDCDRMIRQLERDEPGLSGVDVLMRLPQCAASIDVPIDMVEIGLVTDVAPVIEQKPEEEVPEEAVPEEAPEPEEEPAPVEEEPIDDTEEVHEKRAVEETVEDELVVDEKADVPEPEAEPEEKAPPKKQELIRKSAPKASDDLGFLDDFEDQLKSVKDQRRAEPEAAPPPINKPVLKNVQEPRRGAGDRKGNTASLSAAVRRQISYCWNGVDDLPKEDQINVVVRMELSRDGQLQGSPRLISPRSRPVGRSGIPVDYALRAVNKCAPYKLPADDYDRWKQIDVTIGPQK